MNISYGGVHPITIRLTFRHGDANFDLFPMGPKVKRGFRKNGPTNWLILCMIRAQQPGRDTHHNKTINQLDSSI